MGEDDTDDRLAVARTRDASERAVGVGAAADQGAVADASGKLAGSATSRGGGRGRAVAIEADRSDRPATGRDRLASELHVTLSLAIGDERCRITLRDPGGAGERERAVTDQQDVAARLEDAPGDGDGVRDADQRRDGPALKTVAFHDRSIHLDRAVSVQDRTAAGVEARVVLERAHGALDRVERAATLSQHAPSRQHGGTHTLAELGRLGGIRTGPAVDDDRGHAGRRSTAGG